MYIHNRYIFQIFYETMTAKIEVSRDVRKEV